jgi:hypothetical protein
MHEYNIISSATGQQQQLQKPVISCTLNVPKEEGIKVTCNASLEEPL